MSRTISNPAPTRTDFEREVIILEREIFTDFGPAIGGAQYHVPSGKLRRTTKQLCPVDNILDPAHSGEFSGIWSNERELLKKRG